MDLDAPDLRNQIRQMRHQQRQLLQEQAHLQSDIVEWEKKLMTSKQRQRVAAANYDAAAEAASSLMASATSGAAAAECTKFEDARDGDELSRHDNKFAKSSLQLPTELDKKLRVMSDKLDMRIFSAEIRAALPVLQQRAELLEREASGASKHSNKNSKLQHKHFPSVLLRSSDEMAEQLGEVLEEHLRLKNKCQHDVDLKRKEKSKLLGQIATQRRRLAALREEHFAVEALRTKGLYSLHEEEERLKLLRDELRFARDSIDCNFANDCTEASELSACCKMRGWHQLAFLEIVDPSGASRAQADKGSTLSVISAANNPTIAQVSKILLEQQWICPEPVVQTNGGVDWEKHWSDLNEALSSTKLQERLGKEKKDISFEEFISLCVQLVHEYEVIPNSINKQQ